MNYIDQYAKKHPESADYIIIAKLAKKQGYFSKIDIQKILNKDPTYLINNMIINGLLELSNYTKLVYMHDKSNQESEYIANLYDGYWITKITNLKEPCWLYDKKDLIKEIKEDNLFNLTEKEIDNLTMDQINVEIESYQKKLLCAQQIGFNIRNKNDRLNKFKNMYTSAWNINSG